MNGAQPPAVTLGRAVATTTFVVATVVTLGKRMNSAPPRTVKLDSPAGQHFVKQGHTGLSH